MTEGRQAWSVDNDGSSWYFCASSGKNPTGGVSALYFSSKQMQLTNDLINLCEFLFVIIFVYKIH